MDNEYPKCLYREGDEIHWHDLHLDTKVVVDAEDQSEAEEDGFQELSELLKPKRAAKKPEPKEEPEDESKEEAKKEEAKKPEPKKAAAK